MTIVKQINKDFVYKKDSGKDKWSVMFPAEDGKLYGDCEDYSLTVAYRMCNCSLIEMFYALFRRKFVFHYVLTKAGEGHAVMEHEGKYIDNWTKRWVTKPTMEKLHTFKYEFKLYQVLWKFFVNK